MIPQGRTLYLETAKIEAAKERPNRKKMIMYAKNFGRVLEKDVEKVLGRSSSCSPGQTI